MSPDREIPIIGIYSPYAGAGKSTVAHVLNMRYGFARLKMAGPLKNMLRNYLASQGLHHESIEEMIEGSLKHEPLKVLNDKTPRHAMQTLGTEWGRDCMGVDFWCDAAKTQILRSVQNGLSVVVDDVRFPNEAQMIHDIGGYMVRIRRPSMEVAPKPPTWRERIFGRKAGHSSEGGLNNWTFDLEIENSYNSPSEFATDASAKIITLVHWGKGGRAQTEEGQKPFIGR